MATKLAQTQPTAIERSPLSAEIVERIDAPGAWGVEAINPAGDGEIYMAVFYGPSAQALAGEYAHAKYDNVMVR